MILNNEASSFIIEIFDEYLLNVLFFLAVYGLFYLIASHIYFLISGTLL